MSQNNRSILNESILQVIGAILEPLRTAFEQVVPRLGEIDKAWHASFEKFLAALADRRKHR